MHKLKNKHTGEVIKTPYMAEVEEYLNSGDYEMSDKYPYIGEGKRSGNVVLFTAKGVGVVIAEGESVTDSFKVGVKSSTWEEGLFENITREYLTDTYGKCESQDHADFICKLAKNNEIYVKGFNYNRASYFMIVDNELYFYSSDEMPKRNECKLINLPLPPKGKEMPETNPVYTKEMHERGELPLVGMELLIAYKGGNTFKGKIKYISGDGFVYERENGADSFNGSIDIVEFKPIPKIEDELVDILEHKWDSKALAKCLLAKYNITPKDS